MCRLFSLMIFFFPLWLMGLNDFKEPDNVASTEGLPSGLVNGCVCAISGEFIQSIHYCTLAGPEPLSFTSMYGNQFNPCWSHNHLEDIRVSEQTLNGEDVLLAHAYQPSGARLFYHYPIKKIKRHARSQADLSSSHLEKSDHKKTHHKHIHDTDEEMKFLVPKGLTNGGTNLSGRTNLKNQKLIFQKSKGRFLLKSPAGDETLFVKKKLNDVSVFLPQETSKANGCLYSYEITDKKDGLEHAIIAKNKSTGKSYGNIRVDHRMKDHEKENTIKTSDGRQFELSFLTHKYHQKKIVVGPPGPQEQKVAKRDYYLEQIRSPFLPEVTFKYSSKALNHQLQIKRKKLPDDRFLEIDYYQKGINKLGNLDAISIDDKDDYRLDRVRKLSAPVGTTTKAIPTHWFVYHEKRDAKKRVTSGITSVYDAYFHKTDYEYDQDFHLVGIKRFKGTESYHKYSKELFCWAKGEKCQGDLLGKILVDKHDNIHSARFYQYDDKGNVIQSSFCGSLTGNVTSQITREGFELVGEYESENKHYTYSEDLHLLTSETDSNGVTVNYRYVEGTDLLYSKLKRTKDGIRQREFYERDENGTIILKILDDGVSRSIDNLGKVTERHITRIIPTTTHPIGLPERVEEWYFDVLTGLETSLGFVKFEYNDQGRPLKKEIFDANGNFCYELSWGYDDHGNVIEEKNALGHIIEKKYDNNDNLIYQKGPSQDFYIENVYDFANRLIKQTETHGENQIFVTSYEYNYLGQCTKMTDLYGNETCYEYDDFGRLNKTLHPPLLNETDEFKSPETSQSHDVAGFVTQTIDPNGRVTTTERNSRGQPTKITYPDETTETFIYRLDGKLCEKIEKNGSRMLYELDSLGRIKEENFYSSKKELLKTTKHQYNDFHLIETTDPEGLITTYSYDGAGRLEWTKAGDRATQNLYDSLGRLCEEREWYSDTEYRKTIILYDYLDRVIEKRIQETPEKVLHLSRYDYDAAGNRFLEQIGDQITLTDYNPFGEVIKITNALDEETHITYDRTYRNKHDQRVLKKTTTDPLGYQTVDIYDAANHLIETNRHTPLPIAMQISRHQRVLDLCGNPVRLFDTVMEDSEIKKIIETFYDYTVMDQVKTLIEAVGAPEQKTTKTEYNHYGQKSTVTKPDGIILTYDYDSCGRLASLKSSNDEIDYLYHYNKNDQILDVKDSTFKIICERSYDSHGQLEGEKFSNGLLLSYTYDRIGRPRQLTLPDQTTIEYFYDSCYLKEVLRQGHAVYANAGHTSSGRVIQANLIKAQSSISYRYDPLDRCIAIASPKLNQHIPQCGYDKGGNLRCFHLQGTPYTFDYDDLYQLKAEKGHTTHHYRYDSLANRKNKDSEEIHHNALNQVCQAGNKFFKYDLNGNLIRRGITSQEISYTYDALDRLKSATQNGQTVFFAYDPFNRRMTKIKEGKEQDFLYQGREEIGLIENGSIRQLKITSGGGGQSLALEFDGILYYPLRDIFGNSSCLLNTQGEIVEQYLYTAFGEEEISDAQGEHITHSSNPWRYSCKRIDPDTNLVAFGLRDYDPALGRWLTPDPAEFEDGPNLYAYVHNRPFAYFDEYGLFSVTFGSDPQSSMSHTLWNGAGGMLQGAFDFGANQFYAFNSFCCMVGAHEMDFSQDERLDAIGSFSQSQADFATKVDTSIQQFLRVDSNSSAYQNSRYYTAIAMETGACLSGAYGLAKGGLKGMTNYAARRSAVMVERAAIKTVEKTNVFGQNFFEDVLQNTVKNVTRKRVEFDLNALSKAGQVMDRNGLSKAGRALDKHGSRTGSVFPKANGNPVSKNIQGQFQLDDILTNPCTITKPNKFGGLNHLAPDGRGACFNKDGNLRGFLQP